MIDDTETAQDTETPVDEIPANTAAPWWTRAGAFAVDVVPGVTVVATMALTALRLRLRGVWWWSCIPVGGVAILLTAGNRLLSPVITGWSLGRAVFGIAVVPANGTVIGPWRLLVRDLAHLLTPGRSRRWTRGTPSHRSSALGRRSPAGHQS